MPDVSQQSTPAGPLAEWRVPLAKSGHGAASAAVAELVAGLGLVGAAGAKAAAGALLDALPEFEYDPKTGLLSLDLSAYATDAEVAASIAALKGGVADSMDTLAELAAAIAAIDLSAYAALSGATFSGSVRGPAPKAAADLATKAYVDAAVAAGAPPATPGAHNRLIGWSAGIVPASAEIAAATVVSDSDTLAIPDAQDDGHIFFGVPADPGLPSGLYFSNNPSLDQFAFFGERAEGAAGDFTRDGVAYEVMSTDNELFASVYGTGGVSLRMVY